MARTNTPDTIGSLLAAIVSRVERLERSRRSGGFAVLAADPANPRDGDAWIRSDTGAFRIRVNGVTKTATLT